MVITCISGLTTVLHQEPNVLFGPLTGVTLPNLIIDIMVPHRHQVSILSFVKEVCLLAFNAFIAVNAMQISVQQ